MERMAECIRAMYSTVRKSSSKKKKSFPGIDIKTAKLKK